MNDNWIEVNPYGKAAKYTNWFNGIYKIVSYGDKNEYYAFYIKNGADNWGWYFEKPPHVLKTHNNMIFEGYTTLQEAMQAAEKHAKSGYSPTPNTIKRAQEILQETLLREKEV